MKRLFVLRTQKEGPFVNDDNGQPLCFPNKPAAKAARDTIGGQTVVSYGPDHNLFRGEH